MWLALALAAQAQTCDAKALTKALAEAGPASTGKAFAELAACDPKAATAAAPEAFKRTLAGPNGDAAVLAAVKIGAWQAVRDWVPSLMSDERSSTINKLGQSCDVKEVPAFFIDSAKVLGDSFYSDRWYAGLDDCREASVRELLRAELAKPVKDPIRFKSVLDTYSRNLGADAVPVLKALLGDQKNPELATYIVESFADAAGVGSANGANADATGKAVAAIQEVAPSLPGAAVDKARQTLLALGAELESDKLAAVRYKDVAKADGGLTYGVVLAEIATCKKGDTKVQYHHAQLLDTGHTWPDQVGDRVGGQLAGAFELKLAESCKGTGTTKVVTSDVPFKDNGAYQAWVDARLKELQKENPVEKAKVVPHDPLKI